MVVVVMTGGRWLRRHWQGWRRRVLAGSRGSNREQGKAGASVAPDAGRESQRRRGGTVWTGDDWAALPAMGSGEAGTRRGESGLRQRRGEAGSGAGTEGENGRLSEINFCGSIWLNTSLIITTKISNYTKLNSRYIYLVWQVFVWHFVTLFIISQKNFVVGLLLANLFKLGDYYSSHIVVLSLLCLQILSYYLY